MTFESEGDWIFEPVIGTAENDQNSEEAAASAQDASGGGGLKATSRGE